MFTEKKVRENDISLARHSYILTPFPGKKLTLPTFRLECLKLNPSKRETLTGLSIFFYYF